MVAGALLGRAPETCCCLRLAELVCVVSSSACWPRPRLRLTPGPRAPGPDRRRAGRARARAQPPARAYLIPCGARPAAPANQRAISARTWRRRRRAGPVRRRPHAGEPIARTSGAAVRRLGGSRCWLGVALPPPSPDHNRDPEN